MSCPEDPLQQIGLISGLFEGLTLPLKSLIPVYLLRRYFYTGAQESGLACEVATKWSPK